MEVKKIKSAVESLLFASGEPVKVSKLEKIIGVAGEELETAVREMVEECEKQERGIVCVRNGDEIMFATNPQNSDYVEQLVNRELQGELSKAALEVLSIIAYRGPISRSAIEAIRGVNSSFTLRNLAMRGLIERIDNPRDSRGYLYDVSFDFLNELGISDVTKLPDYAILSKDERVSEVMVAEERADN